MSGDVPAAAADTLLQELRCGGPLARLFQQASSEVRTLLSQVLEQQRPKQLVAALTQTSRRALEAGTDASPLVVLRQCDAGCNACCHNVSADITPLEAIVVAEYLHRVADAATLSRVRSRMLLNTALRANMTPQERLHTRLPCGLLGDNGLCSVYEARPLVCAGVFSLSRTACEASARHHGPAAPTIPLDRPAKAWTMGVSGGLQRALVDAGLDGNLYELNSIVLCALDTPNAAERWLRGEDLFSQCVCTDAHSPPRRLPTEHRRDDAHQGLATPASARQAKGKQSKERLR